MGLIMCRECGNIYNRDIWDECPNCAREKFMPKPYLPQVYFRRDFPEENPMRSGRWDEIIFREINMQYIPRMLQ